MLDAVLVAYKIRRMIMDKQYSYEGKNVLVVGMAKSGISAAKLLLKLNANVSLYDRKTKEELKNNDVEALLEKGAGNMLGADTMKAEEWADCMVLSPGVPYKLDFIQKAIENGKEVISEIELGYRTSKATIVGIGGTNGKTTTTALTGEIFKNAGKTTYVLGNIGVPITEYSLQTRENDVIVAEIAALQLESIKDFRPKAFALLNITEDHQDRFGTMEYYTKCKMRAFENQTGEDYAILNLDDPITLSQIHNVKKSRVVLFSRKQELDEGVFVRDGMIVTKLNGVEKEVCNIDEIRIPGNHNLENALAATALATCMGITPNVIAYTLRTFPGVEHRIEFVKEVNKVKFINDSKGTNPDPTIKAIETMKDPTILILGGYDKHSSFDDMFAHFTDKIVGIVVLGATKDKILAAADRAGYKNVQVADTFERAVQMAYKIASPGGTVLLSPACASWDMFENFEQRGEVFKQIVNLL